MSSDSSPIIRASNLRLSYQLNTYKVDTLKEFLIRKFKRQSVFQQKVALKDISLEVAEGECIGIIGHNGSGKSTLLKILAGVIRPESGSLSVSGTLVPLIELGAGFDPELTGRENIFLSLSIQGYSRQEIERFVPHIESFSELSNELDQPVKTYSSGMYMRLGFSCSTVAAADIILIDEILAVGDQNFQKKCLQKLDDLRKKGTTIVIVSHDLATIESIASRLIVMNAGQKVFDGPIDEGVLFYLDLMEQKRQTALSKAELAELNRKAKLADEPTPLEQNAKIVSVNVFTSDIEPITPTSTVIIEIKLAILRETTDFPSVGFAIQTAKTGIRILGGNQYSLGMQGRHPIPKSGMYSTSIYLKNLQLASGKYDVTVGLHTKDLTKTLDIKPAVASFEVQCISDPQNFDRDLISPRCVVGSWKVTAQKDMGSHNNCPGELQI
ncbi:MAG: ABC transporter ATP-binding protein [Pseudobacteriovorax sp.]|nr:ABC transporter ATP-binding protein [Pseudobacteriovorax sp.]